MIQRNFSGLPRAFALAWLSLLLSVLPVAAQLPFGNDQKASAKAFARAVDDQVQLAIEIQIDEGWHLYHFHKGNPAGIGIELEIELESPGVRFGEQRAPEPERLEQPGVGPKGSDVWIYGHEHTIVVHALGERESGAQDFAPEAVRVKLVGLTCEDNGTCIPYRQDLQAKPVDEATAARLFAQFPTDLSMDFEGPAPLGAELQPTDSAATGSASEGASEAAPRWTDEQYEAWQPPTFESSEPEGSLWLFLLLAFLAGAILNVMPCVLPVISIKVLSFVQQAGEDRRRVFQLGLAFAAGILVVFWGLGIFAITANAGWGEQFQSSTFLITMIGLVFAFALSMFGVFEIGVPSGVGAMATGNREGLGDAFFKGMLATALATPCSGPFLGSTLTWALTQSKLTIFLIFTALGLGMALPYVFLTANPKLLKKLPRPGPWMETFKQAMGFVLVATVLFLMLSLEPRLLLFTLIFLLFVSVGCWWYGRFATFSKPTSVRLGHLAIGLLLCGAGAYLSFGKLAKIGAGDASADWVHFEPELFEQHLAQGRSVFVDFTADWCVNCQTNKALVYDDEQVRAKFREKGVTVFEADETGTNAYTAMLKRLRQSLGANSIPFMAVFPADGPYQPVVRHAIVTKGDLLEILEELPSP